MKGVKNLVLGQHVDRWHRAPWEIKRVGIQDLWPREQALRLYEETSRESVWPLWGFRALGEERWEWPLR